MFDIGRAVDIPGEDTREPNDCCSELDGVCEEWCPKFCDIIVSLKVPTFPSLWGPWRAMGFGGDVTEVGALEVPKRTMSVLDWLHDNRDTVPSSLFSKPRAFLLLCRGLRRSSRNVASW